MERKTDTDAVGPHEADWCALNALADGELSTERQVEAARLVATTPSAGAALRAIVAVKRELSALEPSPAELPVPPRQRVRRSPARRVVAGLCAMAAALLLVLAIGPTHSPLRVAQPDFVTATLTAGPQSATSGAPLPPVTRALEESLALVGLVPLWRVHDASGFVHIGFGGPRGCRLTVHIGSAHEALDAERLSGQQASAWQGPRHAVIVRATSMPAERFEAAVSLVRALLGDELPAIADAAVRARIAAAWRDGRPCLA